MTFFSRIGLFVALVASPTLSAQVIFAPARWDFPAGFSCCSVVGDFNGDGVPDIARLSSPNLTGLVFYTDITILFGNGDGTLRPPVVVSFASALSPAESLDYLVAGDFNGDGRLDLAVSVGELHQLYVSRIMILLAGADGDFQVSSTFAANRGSLQVADFNGDDRPDLMEFSIVDSTPRMSVRLGNSDRTFQAPVTTNVISYGPCVARDLNGDGRADIVLAALSPSRLVILLANDDGAFQTPIEIPFTTPINVSLDVGDLNGDGKLDILLAGWSEGGAVAVYFGNGDGTFQGPVSAPLVGVYLVESASLVDFDHDGMLDLLVLGQTGDTGLESLITYLGNGDGTFRLRVATNAGGIGSNPMTVADFNGDGIPDVVVDKNEFVAIHLGKPDGSFSATPAFPANRNPSSLVMADTNLDGKADLVYLSEEGLWLSAGKGDGTFEAGVKLSGPAPGADTREAAFAGVVAVADLNGDGKPDLINVNTATVSTMLGDGSRSFQPPAVYSVGTSASSGIAVVVADFNGDGKPDLAVIANNKVAILLGVGANGAFQMPPAYYATGSSPVYLAKGDLNGDGKLDLVVVGELHIDEYREYGVSFLAGNGDGTFQPPIRIADPLSVDPQALVVNDFNRDGLPDIAIAFTSGPLYPIPGGVLIILGTGNASFRPPVKLLVPGIIESLGSSDLDGDGNPDLVVGESRSVGVLFGNGDGAFSSPTFYGAGDGVVAIAIGDVNSDSLPDIVTGNYWTKDLSVLLNAGHPQSPAATVNRTTIDTPRSHPHD